MLGSGVVRLAKGYVEVAFPAFQPTYKYLLSILNPSITYPVT
jgi:hypothetical protein